MQINKLLGIIMIKKEGKKRERKREQASGASTMNGDYRGVLLHSILIYSTIKCRFVRMLAAIIQLRVCSV